MVNKKITICHLYHRNMNIYGDTGNVLALKYRLEARGIGAEIILCEVGERLPRNADVVIAGGGQDSGQVVVEADLQRKKPTLQQMAKDGVVMLVICGTYQLFGNMFITAEDKAIAGIGIFDMETKASKERLIGNVVVDSPFGELVGFENHSGKTKLGDGQVPLGGVVKGAGNNGTTGEEGAQYQNVFGSYMHGPLLPKNPRFADELLRRSYIHRYGDITLEPIDDTQEQLAAEVAKSRPR